MISRQPTQLWAGGAYSIKQHGVTITNCDSEPIQTPGCTQDHGVLLVLHPGDLKIIQVSENSVDHLGCTPAQLLGESIELVIGPNGRRKIESFISTQFIERNPLYVFTLPERTASGPLDLLIHSIDGLVVLEFERATGGISNEQPDYYSLVKKSVSRLQNAQTTQEFGSIVVEEVRALTQLDRVMVYKFHEDFHGEVIAESKRDDLGSWLGMHYPAADIPAPAREIFKVIWVRPLPDANTPVRELVPLVNPKTGKPLAMTYCCLRGASVMYTEYLRNMGVAASLTLSIQRDGELWGLIACHHQTPTTFPYQIRAACEFLAQIASLELRSVEQRESLTYRMQLEATHTQLVANAALSNGLPSLVTGTPNLLDGIRATGVALCYSDRWCVAGLTPSLDQLHSLKGWLCHRPEFEAAGSPAYASDSLLRDYPDAAHFSDVASGILAVGLGQVRDCVVLWFRPEMMQEVKWAGNPNDKPLIPGPHGERLTPRKSFELFVESVRGRSSPWKPVEVESALRLRVFIMELVFARAAQLTTANADLLRSNEELDSFAYVASHDLKEPLRGISKYAHQLLESAVATDEENRRRIERLMRLTRRMDSLLDSLLHFSRVGRASLEFSQVDLNEVLEEALEIVAPRRQEIPTDILIRRALPSISCDRMRVREVFTNLLGNALKYNDKPIRTIEVGYLQPGEPGDRGDCPAAALHETIFYVKDNGIGIERRHYELVFKMFKRLHRRDDFGGGSGAGLAIVQKLVQQHQGSIWLDSIPTMGTTFFFTLSASDPSL